jgi:hypothetical protein
VIRSVPLLIVVVIVSACATAPAPPSLTPIGPRETIVAKAGTPAAPTSSAPSPTPQPGVTADAVDPQPDPTPDVDDGGRTDYERELEGVLREDARVGCQPRRFDLPAGATAAVECRIASPLVERVAVYGFLATDRTEDDDHTFLDRAVFAYLDRMDRQGVLGATGDCIAGTPQDVSWMGPEADSDASDAYIQVERNGRTFSVFRYGCFLNEQQVANFRATCGEGTYVGVLGRTSRLDELSAWALRWPDPEMSFSRPGICAGQQRVTY